MLNMIRKNVQDFTAYSPGKSIDEIKAEFGLPQIIKLASNENPLGVSPVVKQVLLKNADKVFRYTQAGTPKLTKAIADFLGVAQNRIVAGNGSDEIIDLLLRVIAEPGQDNIVTFKPCFSMYELQAKLCGVELRQVPLNKDFSFPWEQMLAQLDKHTRLIFVTSPDNPSGYTCKARELVQIAGQLPSDCLFVVDQAYIEFASPQEEFDMLAYLDELPHLVILRTFSKIFGMAGLRLGYGVMPEWLADYMLRVKLPFSVNILAEEAGIAALQDDIYLQETLRVTLSQRKIVESELKLMGCEVFPSQANFLMFQPPIAAEKLFKQLLSRGIIVRPLAAGYNFPDYLRVSIGNEQENKSFLQATAEIINAG